MEERSPKLSNSAIRASLAKLVQVTSSQKLSAHNALAEDKLQHKNCWTLKQKVVNFNSSANCCSKEAAQRTLTQLPWSWRISAKLGVPSTVYLCFQLPKHVEFHHESVTGRRKFLHSLFGC